MVAGARSIETRTDRRAQGQRALLPPAVILAGGLGSRLRSIVHDRPKPMATFGGRPFLELQIEWLRRQGVGRVLLCVGHLHEHVLDHFGDGQRFGLDIDYAVEETALGTGGALAHAASLLSGAFLALNGDSFVDVDLGAFVRFHRRRSREQPSALASLVLSRVRDARDFGVVELDPTGRIERFVEKDARATGPALVSAGIYLIEPELLDSAPGTRPLSLEREILPSAVARGHRLWGFRTDELLFDIGTPSGHERFRKLYEQKWEQR